jgi:hypothetical protein
MSLKEAVEQRPVKLGGSRNQLYASSLREPVMALTQNGVKIMPGIVLKNIQIVQDMTGLFVVDFAEMSVDTKISIELDGVPLPAYLIANFEQAERNLRDIDGKGPTITDLLRLWISTANSWEIEAEFESVLGVEPSMAQPNKEGQFDEDSFGF